MFFQDLATYTQVSDVLLLLNLYQNPGYWFVQIMDPTCVQNTLALHCVDQAPGLCLKKKKKVFDKICKQKNLQNLDLKAAFYPDF